MKKTALFSLLSTILVAGISATPLSSCATVNNNTKAQVINSTTNGYTKITFCLKDTDRSTSKIVGQTVVSVKAGRKFGSITKPEASKTDCEFNYWADANGKQYSDETVIPSTDTILYANFKDPAVEQFTVTLFLNGGSIEGKQIISKTVDKGEILSNILDRGTITPPDGYAFMYWTDETGNKVEDPSQEEINENRSYAVNWEKTFEYTSWNDLKTYCEKLEANQTQEGIAEFCSHFGSVTVDVWDNDNSVWKTKTYYSNPLDGQEKLDSLDKFVGATKTIDLKLTNSIVKQHIVRVVGVNHDTLADGTGTAALTFEFKTLISDTNGKSLAALWNNTATTAGSSFNHIESTIRNNLDGDSNDQVWLEAQAEEPSTTYTRSVKNMLPITPAQVIKKVATTSDSAWASSDTTKSLDDDKYKYSAYCFLPTMKEVGWETGTTSSSTGYSNINEGTEYALWKNSMTTSSYASLIHKQVNNSVTGDYKSFTNSGSTTIKYQGTIYNFAGCNSTAGETGNGSYFWLSSPYIYSSISSRAYGIGSIGCRDWDYVYNRAYPVSPCFCI